MARPRKTGMDYFPHDTTASGDDKLAALEAVFGNDGYAFYFKVLELVYRGGLSPGKTGLSLKNKTMVAVVAKKINVETRQFFAMVEAAVDVGLFDKTAYNKSQVLTSKRIRETIREVSFLRGKYRRKKGGKPGGKQGGKGGKVKESKGKENTPLTPLDQGGEGQAVSRLYLDLQTGGER